MGLTFRKLLCAFTAAVLTFIALQTLGAQGLTLHDIRLFPAAFTASLSSLRGAHNLLSKSSATAAAREPDDLVCVAIVKGKRTGSTWLARTLHNEPCVDRFIPPGHAPDLKLKQQAFETAFDVDDVLSDPAFADSCKAFDTRPANGSRAAAYFDRFRDAQACSPQNFSAALRDSCDDEEPRRARVVRGTTVAQANYDLMDGFGPGKRCGHLVVGALVRLNTVELLVSMSRVDAVDANWRSDEYNDGQPRSDTSHPPCFDQDTRAILPPKAINFVKWLHRGLCDNDQSALRVPLPRPEDLPHAISSAQKSLHLGVKLHAHWSNAVAGDKSIAPFRLIFYEALLCVRETARRTGRRFSRLALELILAGPEAQGLVRSGGIVQRKPLLFSLSGNQATKVSKNQHSSPQTLRMLKHMLRRGINCTALANVRTLEEALSRTDEIFVDVAAAGSQ